MNRKDNLNHAAGVNEILKAMHWQAYYNNGFVLQNDSMAHQTFHNNRSALPISRAQGNNPFAKDVQLSYVVEPERSWLNPRVRKIEVKRLNLYENY